MTGTLFSAGMLSPSNFLILSGIACLYPIAFGQTLDMEPDSPLEHAFRSIHYQFSLVAGIAVGFPMLVDYAFDRFGANNLKREKGLIPRRDAILALMVPNIFLIAYVLPYKKYSYLPCATKMREVFYTYSFLSYATRYCAPVWTNKSILIPAIAFSLAEAIGAINPCNKSVSSYMLWNLIQEILNFVTLTSYLILFYRYVRYIGKMKETKPEQSHYQNNIYVFAFISLGISLIIMNFSLDHKTWATSGYTYLTLYTYSICIFGTSVSVLNGRIVRIEAAHTETMTTIKDIRVSCNVSLDILNDLLTFDKLESGILKLETQFLSPFHFILETINPLEKQALISNTVHLMTCKLCFWACL
eukprot:gene10909-22771_t